MELRGKVSIYAEQEIPDDVWNSMTSEEQEDDKDESSDCRI